MLARTRILALCTAGALAIAPVAAAFGGPAASAAGEEWGPVRALAPNPQGAAIAIDGKGVVTVAWQSTSFPATVVVRQRYADGSWSARTVLGEGGAPQVVADSRGVVTVVWFSHRDGFSEGVVAARRSVDGSWSAPTSLTQETPTSGGGTEVIGPRDLDVAVNARGAVVAAWTWGDVEDLASSRIQSAYRPVNGPWRKAVDVTPANGADEPQVGIAGDGTATVVYGVQAFGEPQALSARVRGLGGHWSSSTPIAAEGYSHDLAVAPSGRAVVVFSPDFSGVRAVTRSDTGRWGKARTLVKGGELGDVDVAASPRGHFVVGMTRGGGRVDVVERAPGGGWSTPARLAQKGTVASEVVVAINKAGDTFVGWGSYGVYGRYRAHGSTWGPQLTAWPDAGVDVLEAAFATIAPSGDVAVLWDQEEEPLRMRVLNAS